MEKIPNFGNRINCKQRFLGIIILQIFGVLSFLKSASCSDRCGGHISIATGSDNVFSPNHPGQYDDVSNCIWIVESTGGYTINLTFSFTGERYAGECSDYIIIRDGGPNSNELGTFCDTHIDEIVISSSKWLFIQLRSDQITGSGTSLLGKVAAVKNSSSSINDITDLVPDCRSYEFACPNRMCLSMSYRCDDYNDCGCIADCDEDGCGSLPINLFTQIMISVSVGVTIFIVICIITFFMDSKSKWLVSKQDVVAPLKTFWLKKIKA